VPIAACREYGLTKNWSTFSEVVAASASHRGLGARMVTTLIYELQRAGRHRRRAMCAGGGQGGRGRHRGLAPRLARGGRLRVRGPTPWSLACGLGGLGVHR